MVNQLNVRCELHIAQRSRTLSVCSSALCTPKVTAMNTDIGNSTYHDVLPLGADALFFVKWNDEIHSRRYHLRRS